MHSRDFILATLLIVAPFGATAADLVVWWQKGSHPGRTRRFGRSSRPSSRTAATLVLIAALAIMQVVVQLRYFPHLDLRPSSRPELLVLLFAAILIFIMVGGS
jgi:Prokaryotic Cytochrome C oxidase subunit IV